MIAKLSVKHFICNNKKTVNLNHKKYLFLGID